ncbi:hypothetical protein [Streptomyces sp. BPTC-684]|uniref:hypothetical protein n=1 Tax=Streptomyces sp. BPTC-684 TaxID=3043734 RepID=UPI0024B07523|nr:hypothetical protein [Streptomyces sp. BPTC-684]WHM37089.1 hypothetical protein QIY60_09390 [Streptomyces sp. BPTC-684]
MGFDEEWASSKAAAARQPVGMRLDGAYDGPFPPSGPGGDKDLNSSASRKNTAANDIETDFEPNTKKAGAWADEANGTAAKAFAGWATGAGLTKAQETWGKSVTALLGRLAGEKSALRGTTGFFQKNDIGVGNDFGPLLRPSSLSQFSPPPHA